MTPTRSTICSRLTVGMIMLLCSCIIASGRAAQAQSPDAISLSLSATHELIINDNQLSSIRLHTLAKKNKPLRLGIRYYHPIVQYLTYSQDHVGPEGMVLLPHNLQFDAGMVFGLKLANETRPLVPGKKNAQVQVKLYPGSVVEEWTWPDGLQLQRTYFQSTTTPGCSIRFKLENKSGKVKSGIRLETRLKNPVISNQGTFGEEAALTTDPRTGLVFVRDGSMNEENWMGMGWCPNGGLITTGDGSSQNYSRTDRTKDTLEGFFITLETPVQDIKPNQRLIADFVLVWGLDKERVRSSILGLQEQSGYLAWETEQQHNRQKNPTLKSKQLYLNHMLQHVKGWAPWLVQAKLKAPFLYNAINDNKQAKPQDVSKAIKGLLLLGYEKAVEQYINYWLDQRSESVNIAYTIINAYYYFILTGDQNWLKENQIRIQEIMQYLDDLDQDQDGLPNYRVLLTQAEGTSRTYEPIFDAEATDLQLFNQQLASIRAYRAAAELIKATGKKEWIKYSRRYKNRALSAEMVLQNNYWDNQLGEFGFYAFARLEDRDIRLNRRSLETLAVNLYHIGEANRQNKILSSIWNQPFWKNGNFYYWSYANNDQILHDIYPVAVKEIALDLNHEVILAGLKTKRYANQAFEFFEKHNQHSTAEIRLLNKYYNEQQSFQGMSIANINYITIILEGLCGLTFLPQGIQINKPLFEQSLDIGLKNIHYRSSKLHYSQQGEGSSIKLTVNGQAVKPGTVLKGKWLTNNELDIKVIREKSVQKTLKTSKKAKKRRKGSR